MRSSAKVLFSMVFALLILVVRGGSPFLTAQDAPPMIPIPQPAAEDGEAPQPFKVDLEVRVLNLRVTVQDKSGRFVQGLGPEEFKLELNGRQIPLRLFHEVRDSEALFPPAEEGLAQAVPAAPGTEEEEADAPVAGLVDAGEEPLHYIFFFDNLHMDPGNRPRVVTRLNRFVDELFGEQDKGLVVNFEQGFNLNTRFTSNPNVLKDSIKRASMQAAFPGGLAGDGPASIYQKDIVNMADRTLGEKSYYAKLSCDALGTLSTFLAGVPGRKVIIFLSEELPVEMGPGLNFGDDRGGSNKQSAGAFNEKESLFSAVRQLNAAEIPVFALDARGLSADTRLTSVASGGLTYLTRETGGKAYIGSSGYTAALREIRDSLRNYYSIGIRTDGWQPDSQYQITIDLPEKKELNVSYQRAMSVSGPDTRMAQETLLLHFDNRLERNPLEAVVEVVAAERVVQDTTQVARLTLAVSLPQSKLGLVKRSGGGFAGELTIFIAARSPDLGYIPSHTIKRQIFLADEEIDPQAIYSYGVRLVFPAADYAVATGIRDTITGESSLIMARAALGRPGTSPAGTGR
jgi:VWFA-related protein